MTTYAINKETTLDAAASLYCDMHGLTEPMMRKWVKNYLRNEVARKAAKDTQDT